MAILETPDVQSAKVHTKSIGQAIGSAERQAQSAIPRVGVDAHHGDAADTSLGDGDMRHDELRPGAGNRQNVGCISTTNGFRIRATSAHSVSARGSPPFKTIAARSKLNAPDLSWVHRFCDPATSSRDCKCGQYHHRRSLHEHCPYFIIHSLSPVGAINSAL
jgi:hypothetical protein